MKDMHVGPLISSGLTASQWVLVFGLVGKVKAKISDIHGKSFILA